MSKPRDMLTMEPRLLDAVREKDQTPAITALIEKTPAERLAWYDANVIDLVSLIAHVRCLTQMVSMHDLMLDRGPTPVRRKPVR